MRDETSVSPFQLVLVDEDDDVVDALQTAFGARSAVRVQHGDICSIARNTVVSPANSHGLMDGGVDRAYLQFFGPRLQKTVLDAIARRPEGLLPVGASEVVTTGHPTIPYMILAPTMIEPEPIVDPSVCYRAMRAVLRAAVRNRPHVTEVCCPGLGTGVGKVHPRVAAREMARAFEDWKRESR